MVKEETQPASHGILCACAIRWITREHPQGVAHRASSSSVQVLPQPTPTITPVRQSVSQYVQLWHIEIDARNPRKKCLYYYHRFDDKPSHTIGMSTVQYSVSSPPVIPVIQLYLTILTTNIVNLALWIPSWTTPSPHPQHLSQLGLWLNIVFRSIILYFHIHRTWYYSLSTESGRVVASSAIVFY